MIKVWRQGDVAIMPLIRKIEDAKMVEKKNKVLAYGETTSHSHRVTTKDTKIFVENAIKDVEAATELVIRAYNPTEVVHEEHEGIVIPVGDHRVVIQREFDWASKLARRVVD